MEAAVSGQLDTAPSHPAPRRAGWRMIARKEFTDHILSVRFTILVLLLGLAGIVAVYGAASGIRDVASQSTDFPALFLKLFTTSPQRIPSFLGLIGLLGPLLGIAFAFDAVNGERTQGTLPRLLSQPIYRDDVINGKFVAGVSVIGIVLVCITLIVGGVGMVRIAVTPTPKEIVRLGIWLVVSIVYISFWLALSALLSVRFRRAATSALVAIALWLVFTLFGSLLVGIAADAFSPVPDNPTVDEQIRNARTQLTLSRILPSTLYEEATVVLLRPEIRSLGILFQSQLDQAVAGELTLDQSMLIAWPQLTALVALTVLCFAGAYVLFMRQEIRA
jgi:ABC-2 type transport system permease protein